MTKLWRRSRDIQGQSRLQEVDLQTLAISSPTVVFMSGHNTWDSKPEHLREVFEGLESVLLNRPEIPKPPQIYVWTHTNSKEAMFNIVAYNGLPWRAFSNSAKKLAAATIMPLVVKDGKPLPVAEAQKNLSNLTLFGYSAGSVVAQEVFNASMFMMQQNGYKADEARKLLNEIVLVTIGPVSRLTRERDRFTTLALSHSDDRLVRLKNGILHPLRSIFSKADRQLTIRPHSDSSILISSAGSQRIRDIRGKNGEKEMDVELRRWHYANSNHSFKDYVNDNDKNSYSSRIIFHALVNAVHRKGKISPYKLLEAPPSLTGAEKEHYQRKIDKARANIKPRSAQG